MTTKEPITYGHQFQYGVNYAAVCCGHVHWRDRLIRSQIVSDQLTVASAKCPFCKKQLVFGEWKGEKNNLECGNKQLGKILSLFNKPCKVKNPYGYCLKEVGKVWFVRIFSRTYDHDFDYYIVPHDKPDTTGCIVHFRSGNDFTEYMKLIGQTEFDCYFTSQKFDL